MSNDPVILKIPAVSQNRGFIECSPDLVQTNHNTVMYNPTKYFANCDIVFLYHFSQPIIKVLPLYFTYDKSEEFLSWASTDLCCRKMRNNEAMTVVMCNLELPHQKCIKADFHNYSDMSFTSRTKRGLMSDLVEKI